MGVIKRRTVRWGLSCIILGGHDVVTRSLEEGCRRVSGRDGVTLPALKTEAGATGHGTWVASGSWKGKETGCPLALPEGTHARVLASLKRINVCCFQPGCLW